MFQASPFANPTISWRIGYPPAAGCARERFPASPRGLRRGIFPAWMISMSEEAPDDGVVRRALRFGALIAFLLGLGLPASEPVAQQRVGVNTAVNPEVTGTPPGAPPRRLVLGQEVVFNERFATGAVGQTQITFIDESTLTIGPNSLMVIDEFVYDPASGTGKLAASLTRGLFRFVGGKLSKQDNAVAFRTPVAVIGIRGGVVLVDLTPDGKLEVIFAYGKGVTVTGLNGISQTITRPGFEVTVSGPGAAPSVPSPAPPGAGAAMLARLDGRPGGNGGASRIPTDAMVAKSGIAAAISSNVPSGVEAQTQQPPSVGTAVQQAETTVPLTAHQLTPANEYGAEIKSRPGAAMR